jgi:NADH-quinone oxidoreductase subunit J
MELLHNILIFFILLSSILVFIVENPVHSVLFLILAFCNACITLILFNAEFLGFLFIIIYVGAIAVLFLFVVMMLNIKIYQQKINYYFVLFFIFCFPIFYIIETAFSFSLTFFKKNNLIDSFSNIEIFGQILYNNYLIPFLICGIILLVAMIGAIVLTLNFHSQRRNEITFRQLSRSNKFISFFN